MGQSSHSRDGGGCEEIPQHCQDFALLLKGAKEVSENASKVPLQAVLVGFLPPELLQGAACPAWDRDKLELF